jgi:hypothetical protein
MSNNQPEHYFIQRTDDRLSKVEEAVGELRSDVAVMKVQLSDGISMLSEKLDALHGLKAQVEKMEVTEKVRYRVFKIAVTCVTALAAVAGFVLKLLVG